MSWRAGMHGSEPVTWEVKRTARSRGEPVEVGRVELGAAVAAEHVPVQTVEQEDDDVARLAHGRLAARFRLAGLGRGCVGRGGHRVMVGAPPIVGVSVGGQCQCSPRPSGSVQVYAEAWSP